MKIKVETTLHLSEHDIACIKFYMKDLGITDETFRDFVKSHAAAYAQYFIDQSNTHYGEYVE